ncbi:MAG: DUF899 domain-containing protein [Inquilinaceae bacterium]
MQPTIVSREDWLTARKVLLAEERDLTHRRDRIAEKRRRLPWVKVEKAYVFDTPDGPKTLADLFQGRGQLFVHHFMLAPGSDHVCSGCAAMCDHVDAARAHFEHADLSFAAVSRASVEEIERVRRRMGWTFQWVSCGQNGFSHDYGASFTPAQIERGETGYNYGTTPYAEEDLPATSIFAMDDVGTVFHTYSAYTRGTEQLFTPFNFLDFVPKGRNEAEGTMSWVRLRDEYDDAPAEAAACCGAGR